MKTSLSLFFFCLAFGVTITTYAKAAKDEKKSDLERTPAQVGARIGDSITVIGEGGLSVFYEVKRPGITCIAVSSRSRESAAAISCVATGQ